MSPLLLVPGQTPAHQPEELEPSDEPEFEPPDGGWGWVVAFASFWVNGTVFGMLNTFGILLPALIKEFGAEDDNINFKVCEYYQWMIFS